MSSFEMIEQRRVTSIPSRWTPLGDLGWSRSARIAKGRADDPYLNEMLLALARAVGLEPEPAAAIVSTPLALDADSLIAMTHALANRRKRASPDEGESRFGLNADPDAELCPGDHVLGE
jgi:hypothetical protein